MAQKMGSHPFRQAAASAGAINVGPLRPQGLNTTGLIGGIFGTLLIHGTILALAFYFSRPPEEKEEYTPPRRVIIATQVPKLGGSGGAKVDPQALPDKPKPPPSKAPEGMAAPIPDPEKPPQTPTDNNKKPTPPQETPKKPSLEELIRQNAQGQATEEGEGEGTGSGPGVANGSPTGTGTDPNAAAGWIAEVGSLIHTYWTRPGSISDAKCRTLVAEVRVKLNNNLAIEEYELKRSSGNDIFDSSLGPAFGRMITDGARFPMPPPEAGISKKQLTSGRLVIQFTCEKPK